MMPQLHKVTMNVDADIQGEGEGPGRRLKGEREGGRPSLTG